jgi:hypothetical protein
MRGVDLRSMRTRVKGRPVLLRRLHGLLMAVHRYGRCRASTHDEIMWAARLIDRLQSAFDEAQR